MREYHKIDIVFKRDPATNNKALILGDYAHEAFEYLANNKWVFTEKVDGTNIRIMIEPLGGLCFGGKTDNAQIPADLAEHLRRRLSRRRKRCAPPSPTEAACTVKAMVRAYRRAVATTARTSALSCST
jgi:hypothetical protein